MPLLAIAVFIVLFVVILVAASIGFKFLEQQRRSAIAGTLRNPDQSADRSDQNTSILENVESRTSLLKTNPAAQRALSVLQQSGLSWTVPQLLIASGIGGVAGLLLGGIVPVLIFPMLSRIGLGILLAYVPWLFVSFKRRKRLAEIEKQFPECLDFLARSMRAGHAFTISLEMLGQETPDPLGQEIRTVYNEQNLGAPLEIALENFVKRVPLTDVRFFVSTVLLQRRTGGNLSEILLRLAHVIRERFQIKGQVKAVSAHGRITAAVLVAIPIVMVAGLMITSPKYLKGFIEDPDGKWLLLGALVGQILGYLSIKKIVNIKV